MFIAEVCVCILVQTFFSYLLRAVSLEEGDWIKEMQQNQTSQNAKHFHDSMWLHDPVPSVTAWRNYHMDCVSSDIHGAVLKCWNILVFVISQVLRIWDPWTWVRRSDWCDASTSAHKCHLQQQEFWKQETKKHSKTNQTDSKDSRWQDHFDKVICFYVYVRPKSPWALPLHPNCIGNLGVVPLKDESLVELNACENWKSWHCHFIHLYQSMRIYANLWFYHSPWSEPFLISYPSLSHQCPTLQLKCLLFPNVFQLVIEPWSPVVPFGSPDVVYGFFAGSPGGGGIICEEKLRLGSRHVVRRADGEGADGGRIEAWTRSIGSDGRLPESYQTLRSSAQKTSGLWRILKQSSDLLEKKGKQGGKVAGKTERNRNTTIQTIHNTITQ